MPMHGTATRAEKDALCEQLAFLYMEKSDTAILTPEEFAEHYFNAKPKISAVVDLHQGAL